MKFSQYLAVLLGFFEFYAGYEVWTKDISQTNVLVPSYFMVKTPIKVLYTAYVLTLGLQRLTWGFTKISTYSYLCIVATHAVEAYLWWNLALDKLAPLKVGDIVQSCIKGDISGGPLTTVLLIGVPSLTLLFAMTGLPVNQSGKKKTN